MNVQSFLFNFRKSSGKKCVFSVSTGTYSTTQHIYTSQPWLTWHLLCLRSMACWMNGCEERDVWKHDVMNKCSLLSVSRCYTFYHSSLQTRLCRREHVLTWLIHLKLQTATCHDKHVYLNRNTVMSY